LLHELDMLVGMGIAALVGAAGAWALAERRRTAPAKGPTKWCSAGGVVLNDVAEIALVLQRKRRRLRWTLPKGRIDPGETAEVAALREVREESGLEARIVRLLVLHDGPRHHTYYYEMALERDLGVHDHETREVRFVSLEEAVRRIGSKRDLAVLRRLLAARARVV
jgi:ADP-ribose pyrophosphatase YjhB (NUDIX family)